MPHDNQRAKPIFVEAGLTTVSTGGCRLMGGYLNPIGNNCSLWLIDSATSAVTTGQWTANRILYYGASNKPEPLPDVTTLFDNGLVVSMAGAGVSATLLVQLRP